jgi:hypothetical protein
MLRHGVPAVVLVRRQTAGMTDQDEQAATQRVRRAAGEDVVRVLEQDLSQTDLTTLLMSVATSRAARVDPGRILTRSARDRFTRPAASNPRVVATLEARLWQLLPSHIEGLELSPLAPLGISSALAGVAQSRVVSTVRGSEVVSDATNALALEAARGRRAGSDEVHLAGSHRVLRAQRFHDSTASAHFRLFNLVSSTRDRGSGTAQDALLLEHLRAWTVILNDVLGSVPWHVGFTVFRHGAVGERLIDTVLPALDGWNVRTRDLPTRTGADYYTDVAFKIHVGDPGEEVELGDGGLTDWTAQLLNDAKERTLVSCIATERLAALVPSL